MNVRTIGEYDYEPIRGLPGRLPAGEELLWQGAPDARAVALRILHARPVAIYFALVILWRLGPALAAGRAQLAAAVPSTLLFLALALTVILLIAATGWLIARTTVYSITNRRVVLRFGVAFPMSVNVPLRIIQEVSLQRHPDGSGELALTLGGEGHMAWLHLWPHVRPWRLSRPQPALRCVADAGAVSDLLCGLLTAAPPPAALAASAGAAAQVAA